MIRKVNTEGVTVNDCGRLFLQYCEKLQIAATQRQWNAFRRGTGKLHAEMKREAGHNRGLRARMIAAGVWL